MCLGVLFALTAEQVKALRAVAREDLTDYVSDELEELFFEKHREWAEELDKSWDAMHRILGGGELLFGNEPYPLAGVILGGEVLYGDAEDEDDYIITLKTPELVQAIAQALPLLTEAECRDRYFALTSYAGPFNEDDWGYTWAYLSESVDFWQRAAKDGRSVLFTVDQ